MDDDFGDYPEPYEDDLKELGDREAFEDQMAEREGGEFDGFNAEAEAINQDFENGLIAQSERSWKLEKLAKHYGIARGDNNWEDWAQRFSEEHGPEHDLPPDEPMEEKEF